MVLMTLNGAWPNSVTSGTAEARRYIRDAVMGLNEPDLKMEEYINALKGLPLPRPYIELSIFSDEAIPAAHPCTYSVHAITSEGRRDFVGILHH